MLSLRVFVRHQKTTLPRNNRRHILPSGTARISGPGFCLFLMTLGCKECDGKPVRCKSSRSTSLLYSILPIVWSSAQVCNGDYKYLLLADLVNNTVWKASCLAPSCSLGTGMPCFGKFGDSIQSDQHFRKKFIANSDPLTMLVLNSLVKFELGDLQKPDTHSSSHSFVFFEHFI